MGFGLSHISWKVIKFMFQTTNQKSWHSTTIQPESSSASASASSASRKPLARRKSTAQLWRPTWGKMLGKCLGNAGELRKIWWLNHDLTMKKLEENAGLNVGIQWHSWHIIIIFEKLDVVPSQSPVLGGSFVGNPSFVGGEIVSLFKGLSKAGVPQNCTASFEAGKTLFSNKPPLKHGYEFILVPNTFWLKCRHTP